MVFSRFVNTDASYKSFPEKNMKLKPLLVIKDKYKLLSWRKGHFSAVLVLISTVEFALDCYTVQ